MESSDKPKKPQALKRKVQSDKARLRNKKAISSVKNALKNFKKTVGKDGTESYKYFCLLSSLSDKAVKKGCMKANKAARVKSKARLLLNAS